MPAGWLDQLNPKLIVMGEAPSEHLNYCPGHNTITQNSAGDITFDCISKEVRVYVSNPDYSVDFLEYELKPNTYGTYIGTLKVG